MTVGDLLELKRLAQAARIGGFRENRAFNNAFDSIVASDGMDDAAAEDLYNRIMSADDYSEVDDAIMPDYEDSVSATPYKSAAVNITTGKRVTSGPDIDLSPIADSRTVLGRTDAQRAEDNMLANNIRAVDKIKEIFGIDDPKQVAALDNIIHGNRFMPTDKIVQLFSKQLNDGMWGVPEGATRSTKYNTYTWTDPDTGIVKSGHLRTVRPKWVEEIASGLSLKPEQIPSEYKGSTTVPLRNLANASDYIDTFFPNLPEREKNIILGYALHNELEDLRGRTRGRDNAENALHKEMLMRQAEHLPMLGSHVPVSDEEYYNAKDKRLLESAEALSEGAAKRAEYAKADPALEFVHDEEGNPIDYEFVGPVNLQMPLTSDMWTEHEARPVINAKVSYLDKDGNRVIDDVSSPLTIPLTRFWDFWEGLEDATKGEGRPFAFAAKEGGDGFYTPSNAIVQFTGDNDNAKYWDWLNGVYRGDISPFIKGLNKVQKSEGLLGQLLQRNSQARKDPLYFKKLQEEANSAGMSLYEYLESIYNDKLDNARGWSLVKDVINSKKNRRIFKDTSKQAKYDEDRAKRLAGDTVFEKNAPFLRALDNLKSELHKSDWDRAHISNLSNLLGLPDIYDSETREHTKKDLLRRLQNNAQVFDIARKTYAKEKEQDKRDLMRQFGGSNYAVDTVNAALDARDDENGILDILYSKNMRNLLDKNGVLGMDEYSVDKFLSRDNLGNIKTVGLPGQPRKPMINTDLLDEATGRQLLLDLQDKLESVHGVSADKANALVNKLIAYNRAGGDKKHRALTRAMDQFNRYVNYYKRGKNASDDSVFRKVLFAPSDFYEEDNSGVRRIADTLRNSAIAEAQNQNASTDMDAVSGAIKAADSIKIPKHRIMSDMSADPNILNDLEAEYREAYGLPAKVPDYVKRMQRKQKNIATMRDLHHVMDTARNIGEEAHGLAAYAEGRPYGQTPEEMYPELQRGYVKPFEDSAQDETYQKNVTHITAGQKSRKKDNTIKSAVSELHSKGLTDVSESDVKKILDTTGTSAHKKSKIVDAVENNAKNIANAIYKSDGAFIGSDFDTVMYGESDGDDYNEKD